MNYTDPEAFFDSSPIPTAWFLKGLHIGDSIFSGANKAFRSLESNLEFNSNTETFSALFVQLHTDSQVPLDFQTGFKTLLMLRGNHSTTYNANIWIAGDNLLFLTLEATDKENVVHRKNCLIKTLDQLNKQLLEEECIVDAIAQSLKLIGQTERFQHLYVYAIDNEHLNETERFKQLFSWPEISNEVADEVMLHETDIESPKPAWLLRLEAGEAVTVQANEIAEIKMPWILWSKIEVAAFYPVMKQKQLWGFVAACKADAQVVSDEEDALLRAFSSLLGNALVRDAQRIALDNNRKVLEFNEERYRMIAENTSDGIIILNQHFEAEYISPAYLKQINCKELASPSDQKGLYFQVIDPSFLDKIKNNLQEAVQLRKEQTSYLYKANLCDGRTIWLEDHANFVFDEQLLTTRIYIISREITERKLHEEQIELSEKKFRAITETANDGILVADQSGNIIFANPKAHSIFGFEANELIDQPINIIIPAENHQQHHQLFQQFVITHVSKMMQLPREFKGLHKSGKIIPVEISLSNWIHLDETFISANIRDISERKKNEQLLRIQNNITNAVSESPDLSSFIQIIQQQLSIVTDTTNFYVAFHHPDKDLFTAPYCADELDNELEWKASRSLTGYVVTRNQPMLLKKWDIDNLVDKGVIDRIGCPAVCWMGVPLLEDGKAVGAFVLQSYSDADAYSPHDLEMMQFVSGQIALALHKKKAEQELQLLIKAVEQSPVSIVVTDEKGVIEYVNPKFCEVSGYEAKETIGHHTRMLKSGKQAEEVYRQMWLQISSGAIWSGELQNIRKNRELYWERVTISPISDLDGKISHYVAIKEDITAIKKMTDDLAQSRHLAEAGSTMKTAFLNNISHEIRTPLTHIIGFLEVIFNFDLTEEERSYYIGLINKSSDRLLQTVTDYVDISQIQSHLMESYPGNVDFRQLTTSIFSKAVKQYADKALESELRIEEDSFDDEPERLTHIHTDQDLLSKALSHLVDNAFKFTKKGKVSVTLRKHGNELLFMIEDSGIGIDPLKQKSIFESFTHAEAARSRIADGSGLGLSIVKGIAGLLNGNVWLKSQPGLGSTF